MQHANPASAIAANDRSAIRPNDSSGIRAVQRLIRFTGHRVTDVCRLESADAGS